MTPNIKADCSRCGCDKSRIVYQNSGPIVRIYCPECKYRVEEFEMRETSFNDIFEFWNWKSNHT